MPVEPYGSLETCFLVGSTSVDSLGRRRYCVCDFEGRHFARHVGNRVPVPLSPQTKYRPVTLPPGRLTRVGTVLIRSEGGIAKNLSVFANIHSVDPLDHSR